MSSVRIPAKITRPSRLHRTAFSAAVLLTAAAALQQVLIIIGFGRWLPGWQPWPYLLGAAPAWLLARPARQHSSSVSLAQDSVVARLRAVPPGAYFAVTLGLVTALWAWFQSKEPYIAHEEAVYANKARSWMDGTPDAGWATYRPVGLPLLGRLALAVHNDVGALRCVALLLLLFTLTTVYVVASQWLSPRRAVVAVLLLLSGLGFLRRAPEFLNDIGATGLLLIVVFLLVRAQEKQRSRALLVMPFFVLAAFYLRYGVVGNLLAIAVAAVLAYGGRSWLARGRHLAAAAAILFLGLLPHFLYATKATGSPLGIIFSATDQAERAYVGDGLVYYVAIFPYRLAGDLGAVVMAMGLFAMGCAVQRLWRAHRVGDSSIGSEDRRRVFLGTSAVFIFVILGIATDGEPRFVYLSVVLLTLLGISELADLAGRWAPQILTAVAALAAVTVLGTAQIVAHGAMPQPNHLNESTVTVAQRLRGEEPCLLVTGYEPTMGWYSGCDAVTYAQFRAMNPTGRVKVSLVLFEHGTRQPGALSLKRLIGDRDTTTRRIPAGGSIGAATVITLK